MSLSYSWVNTLDFGIKTIIIFFAIFFLFLFRPVLQKYDPVGYYSWIRTVVIDHDLDISADFAHFDFGNRLLIKTNTKYPAQPWAIGSAILWCPFFMIGHTIVLVANYFGSSISPDGYTLPYVLFVSFGSALYALIGLLIIYKMIKTYYGQKLAIISVLSIWLASPLVFYMYSHPMMSHANDMFAYALLLFAWQRTRQSKENWSAYVFLGAAAGVAALIRNQNALLPLLIVAFIIVETFRKQLDWQQGLAAIAIFSLVWWITFFPQLYIWHATFGVWFSGKPTSKAYLGGGDFH
jgi:hypothetical protein